MEGGCGGGSEQAGRIEKSFINFNGFTEIVSLNQ